MIQKIEFLFDEFRKKHNTSPDFFLIGYNDHMALLRESMGMNPNGITHMNGALLVVSHAILDDEYCFVTR